MRIYVACVLRTAPAAKGKDMGTRTRVRACLRALPLGLVICYGGKECVCVHLFVIFCRLLYLFS